MIQGLKQYSSKRNILFQRLSNKSSNNVLNNSYVNYFGALLSNGLPRGFGNFSPDEDDNPSRSDNKERPSDDGQKAGDTGTQTSNDTKTNKRSKSKKFTYKSSSSKKNDSGFKFEFPGGNNGGNDDERSQQMQVILTLFAIMFYLNYTNGSSGAGQKEISWQEFQSQLLESGQVDRLIVSNKNLARVVLRSTVPVVRPDGSVISPDQSNAEEQNNIDSFSNNMPNLPWKQDSSDTSNSGSSYEFGSFGSFGDSFDNQSGSLDPKLAQGSSEKDKSDRFSRYPRIGAPPVIHTPYYFAIGSIDSFERKLDEAQRNLGVAPRDFIPVVYTTESSWWNEALKLLPYAFIAGLYFFVMRGMGGGMGSGGAGNIFRIGQSKAKRIASEDVSVKFKDVAGCDEAKREIMEFVEFLKSPKRFTDLGAKVPRGALLQGPPGTGKTLLAKATAGEANVPFFSISGSDFVEMFVGVGPSRMRDLFKQARKEAPCIIFIDEIDAVGRKRGRSGFGGGGNDERENTLNQLLVEMDGMNELSDVVVLAGTNRADVLDDALLRPGRFDRQITVDRPDIKGRKAIFEVHLDDLTLDGEKEEFSGRLAALTPQFSGADIANICNEAAIQAARKNKPAVDFEDFEKAADRVIGGLESGKIMSPEERRIVAYHEAGHAVAGWMLPGADPLLKVTIIPRGSGALGYAQYLPKELFLRTQEQIMDTVCMALAGRASEQTFFGNVTTGASDDLRRVTSIVHQLVTSYGMSPKVGQVSYPRDDNQFGPSERLYSESTAQLFDSEIKEMIDSAYERTLQLMTEHKNAVELVAELLLEKETITNSDVAKLIGERPHSSGKEYEAYLTWQKITKEEEVSKKETETTNDDSGTGGFQPTFYRT